MKTVGSQIREDITKDDTYTLVEDHDNNDGEIIVFNKVTQKQEIWIENDQYAGYVLVVNGIGYEFVR